MARRSRLVLSKVACVIAALMTVAAPAAAVQVIPPGLPGDPNSAPRVPRRPPQQPAAPVTPPVQPPVPPVQPPVPPVQPPVPPVQPAVPPVQPAVPPVQPAVPPVQPAVPPAGASTTTTLAPTEPPAAAPPAEPKVSTRFRRPRPPTFPGAKVNFPSFKDDHWTVGEPVKAFEPGKIYAIEFFSTTCGHCREAAPLVAELVNVFGEDVVFFGVTDEPLDKVRAYIGKPENAEKIVFPVVSDPDKEGNKAFQYGTFKVSTPRIFIVKDGVLQWYGHPNGAQATLDGLLEGTWDPASVASEFIVDSCMERAKDHLNKMRQEIDRTGEWASLYALLDSMKSALPERASYFELQKFGTMIGPDGQHEAGYLLARQIVENYKDDIASLRTVARTILNSPWVQVRDLPFAHEVALKADALGQAKDARAAEILALSWFSQGDRDRALAEINRAIELETEPKLKARYEASRKRYTTDPPGPVPHVHASKESEHVDHDQPHVPPSDSAPMPAEPAPAPATPAPTAGAPAASGSPAAAVAPQSP
jgi:thiol-disulfide isomerase/thioredoxin